jgi:hypothetical protein
VEGVVEGGLFQPVPKDGCWIDTQAAGANPILVREGQRNGYKLQIPYSELDAQTIGHFFAIFWRYEILSCKF